MIKCFLGTLLDDGAIRERVTEGDANLNRVRASIHTSMKIIGASRLRRITRGKKGNQFLHLRPFTMSTSLSPRPETQTTRMEPFFIRLASFSAWATA